MTIRNIKLTIAYDGSGYHGWQIQPGVETIEGFITGAVEKLCGERVKVVGSSRTDAGVSALGQVANIRIETAVPTENFARALTQFLPDEIAVVKAEDVCDDFDAIRSTKTKRYRYAINTSEVVPVLQIRHCWHYPNGLDVEAMREAAGFLVGKKDFKSFASAADTRQSSVRRVLLAEVIEQGDWIYFDIEADGFLYNMVRNIVGTLVEVGRGYWPAGKIAEIIEAKDRCAAGAIAAAVGLCLMEINY